MPLVPKISMKRRFLRPTDLAHRERTLGLLPHGKAHRAEVFSLDGNLVILTWLEGLAGGRFRLSPYGFFGCRERCESAQRELMRRPVMCSARSHQWVRCRQGAGGPIQCASSVSVVEQPILR